MKVIVLDHFGDRETMKLQVIPVPEVGPDEAPFSWPDRADRVLCRPRYAGDLTLLST
jgi:hypothetical protein